MVRRAPRCEVVEAVTLNRKVYVILSIGAEERIPQGCSHGVSPGAAWSRLALKPASRRRSRYRRIPAGPKDYVSFWLAPASRRW